MKEILRKIGLTEGEIKVYLALLETGASGVTKITKVSGISGSKVYEVLDRLGAKGLSSYTTLNGVRCFEAAPPIKILNYLEEKKSEIEIDKVEVQKIIPELLLKQQNSPKAHAKIYTGWEGMKTVNEDIINTLKKGDEWLDMGLSKQPKSWEIYFNRKQIERAKKGIVLKSIMNEDYKELYFARKRLPHTFFHFFPKEFKMPISTAIYKNKVAIFILLQEFPMTIVMESKEIADGFRKYFYVIWNKSQPEIRKKLLSWKPISLGKGSKHTSEDVDSILYGGK